MLNDFKKDWCQFLSKEPTSIDNLADFKSSETKMLAYFKDLPLFYHARKDPDALIESCLFFLASLKGSVSRKQKTYRMQRGWALWFTFWKFTSAGHIFNWKTLFWRTSHNLLELNDFPYFKSRKLVQTAGIDTACTLYFLLYMQRSFSSNLILKIDKEKLINDILHVAFIFNGK